MMTTFVLGFACILFVAGCGNRPTSAPTVESIKSDQPVAKTETTSETPKSAPDDQSPPTIETSATASSEPKPAEQVVPTEQVSTEQVSTEVVAVESPPNVDTEKTNVQKAEPLDLTSVYQTPAANFKGINTYPWRDAPIGSQTFGNVPLEIGGMICLWGARNAEGGLVFPYYVEGIPVQRKFDALYVYHADFNNADDGTPVSNLIFNFEDGTHSAFEVACGAHLKDWLVNVSNPIELTDPKSKLVVRRRSSMSTADKPRELRFYITEIANPQPTSEVTTIDVVSAKERSSYCLLAITTGPAGLLKMESPPETQ